MPTDRLYGKGYSETVDQLQNHRAEDLSGTSVVLDFDPIKGQRKILTLSGATTFTSNGLLKGRSIDLILIGDGSSRNLTLPAGWVCLGTAPTALAANKKARLQATCTTGADSGVVYTYNVQP